MIQYPDILSESEERALAYRIVDGDRAARDLMIRSNLPLADWHAKQVANAGPSRDAEELFGSACVGLIRAVDRYDPTRDERLATFAWRLIRAEIWDAIRHDRTIYIPRHSMQLMMLPIDQVPSNRRDHVEFARKAVGLTRQPQSVMPWVESHRAAPGQSEDARWVAELVRRLDRTTREIMALRYGLDDGDARPFRDIASTLGLPDATVRLRHSEGIRRLRLMTEDAA